MKLVPSMCGGGDGSQVGDLEGDMLLSDIWDKALCNSWIFLAFWLRMCVWIYHLLGVRRGDVQREIDWGARANLIFESQLLHGHYGLTENVKGCPANARKFKCRCLYHSVPHDASIWYDDYVANSILHVSKSYSNFFLSTPWAYVFSPPVDMCLAVAACSQMQLCDCNVRL